MSDAAEKILQAMKQANKALRPGEIAELTKLEKAEVSKMIQKLKNEGKVISPKACFWAPAE